VLPAAIPVFEGNAHQGGFHMPRRHDREGAGPVPSKEPRSVRLHGVQGATQAILDAFGRGCLVKRSCRKRFRDLGVTTRDNLGRGPGIGPSAQAGRLPRSDAPPAERAPGRGEDLPTVLERFCH
jgi:hypothetical protein